VEPGTEPAALGLVPSPNAALEAELVALEATGSEEISVKVPAVDVRIIDGNQVEGDGVKTLETTMSLTIALSQWLTVMVISSSCRV